MLAAATGKPRVNGFCIMRKRMRRNNVTFDVSIDEQIIQALVVLMA